MNIGFTGTGHKPLTQAQRAALPLVIAEAIGLGHSFAQFHHGDCVEADAAAAQMVSLLFPSCRIVVHPPTDPKRRAFWKGNGLEVVLPAKPYLVRNHDIVDATHLLIACPGEAHEVLRSGTWATVRYARKKGKPIWVITPDGNLRKENV